MTVVLLSTRRRDAVSRLQKSGHPSSLPQPGEHSKYVLAMFLLYIMYGTPKKCITVFCCIKVIGSMLKLVMCYIFCFVSIYVFVALLSKL